MKQNRETDKPTNETKFHFTVQQLISELSKFPGDLPLLTNGYETGYENIMQPFVMELEHLPENPYWDGEFQQCTNNQGFKAVILQRSERMN